VDRFSRSAVARGLRFCIYLGIALAGPVLFGANRTVTLEWDRSVDDDIVGYRLHYGFQAGVYTVSTNVGMVLRASVELPVPGLTYYFAATAVNEEGVESEFSNEVIHYLAPDGTPVRLLQITVQAQEDLPAKITWLGSSAFTNAFLAISRPPAHGTFQGSLPDLNFVPNPDFWGEDSFEMYVVGGLHMIDKVSGRIVVGPVPDAPIAFEFEVITQSGKPVAAPLTATHPDSLPMTYQILQGPAFGTLSGMAPDLIYMPQPDFVGVDEFMYSASDGILESQPGKVRVWVTEPFIGPQTRDEEVHVPEDSAITVELWNDTVDGSALEYRVTRAPELGSLSGETPPWIYTPRPDVHGTDSLTYEAVWGSEGLMTVFLTIQIDPVNDPPAVSDLPVFLLEGMPVRIKLTGVDIEEDPLTFQIVEPPRHGTLYGDPPDILYEPHFGYTGPDEFRFRALDGRAESGEASVRLTVAVIPRIQPSLVDGNRMILSWASIPGRVYRVLHKAALDAPWSEVGTANASGGGELTWAVDLDPNAGSSFYAVELVSP
jgi:hypothetical protein